MFCQSCSMPIDDAGLRGTEKDGSKSNEYCLYCYVNGAFINPDMKLDEMRNIVKTQMEKMHSPPNIIQLSLDSLPNLKRWREKTKTT
ncbi:MAG: hypothetical protein FD123_679 [Bacteroidetes bacterium]|nr:MAG: hypothetical protein FD123_679 [Bacteroidota bacterium]